MSDEWECVQIGPTLHIWMDKDGWHEELLPAKNHSHQASDSDPALLNSPSADGTNKGESK